MRFTQILLLLFIVSCNVAQMKPQIQTGAQAGGSITGNRVSFTDTQIQGNENFLNAIIPITFREPLPGDTDIFFSFSGSATGGTSCIANVDYVYPTGMSKNIPAGASSAVLTFQICSDDFYEGDEVIQVSIAGSSPSISIASPSTLSYNLKERSTKPIVTFGSVSTNVSEGNAGTVLYNDPLGSHVEIYLTRPSVETVKVDLVLSGNALRTSGACASTVDYRLTQSFPNFVYSNTSVISVTFDPLQTSFIVPVEVCGDTIIESNESIQLSLQTPLNASLGGQSTHTFTLLNDDLVAGDTKIVAQSNASDVICDEPVAGVATCLIQIDFTGQKNETTYLNYTVDNVTDPLPGLFKAKFLDDFYFPAHPTVFTGSVAVPAQSTNAYIQVAVKADQLYEAQESFIVKLLPSDEIEPDPVFDNTVVNIDASDLALKPRVSFSQPFQTVVESNQVYAVRVRLVDPTNQNNTRPSGTPVIFDLVASGLGPNMATVDVDYFYSTSLTNITIPAGDVQIIIPLTIVQDGVDEFDETFEMSLDLFASSDYNSGLYAAGTVASQEISIVDIDPQPTVSFETMVTYVTSSPGSDVAFSFNLVFSHKTEKPVSFNLLGAGSYPVSATCSGGQRVAIGDLGVMSFPAGIGSAELLTPINGVVCQETYPPSGSVLMGIDTLDNLNLGILGTHTISIY